MSWKNIMNKNNWVFQQVELIESNVCLENPGRGWYGIYTFVVQDSINPEEMESERWRTSCTGIAGYQYISQYATG